MAFTKKFNEDFFVENNRIKLSPKYLEKTKPYFKKITGSRFANVLGINKFSSPVQTWATMVGIYKEGMDPILSQAGNVIEPKIRDYVAQKLKIDYRVYNPQAVKWDVFPENSIFGGIPDGEPINADGSLAYPQAPMLEIKTSSVDSLLYKQVKLESRMVIGHDGLPIVKRAGGKRAQWNDENGNFKVSDNYKLQLALYLYLRKIAEGLFAVCFLHPEDYVHPQLCDVTKREIKLVKMHADHARTEGFIQRAASWYKQYVLTGISPELTRQDIAWFEDHLRLDEANG